MEKKFKPVPDVEQLRYKGTPENPDIKIFVSHRIDLDSETIDNPLYIPVRCGAVYDDRDNIEMLGDDTGDNISEKRMSFCELTVQYWAWKNVKADYYGLCHYRRYLSFSNEIYDSDYQELVQEPVLNNFTAKQYGLLDEMRMRKHIREYDAIISSNFDVRQWPRPADYSRNVFNYWKELNQLVEYDSVMLLMKILKKLHPEYVNVANKYMTGHSFRGYNCFILKKDLFYSLCDFEFSILFELEKLLDTSGYSEKQMRTCAYLGEILESIWIEKNLIQCPINKYAVSQIVMFNKIECQPELSPAYLDKNTAIVLISSDYYTPYTAVCLQSIICHASEENNYDIIVLSADMSDTNQRVLKRMGEQHSNFSIRFYDPEPIIYEYRNKLSINPRINMISFYRIALPYLFPEYKKMICIDCDLVLEKDIAELDEIPVQGYFLAAVRDVLVQGFVRGADQNFINYYDDKLKDVNNYVNTGVAIYNLDEWRQEYTFEDVMQLSAKKHYFIQEQDVINILVEDKCRLMDDRWNVVTYCGGYFKMSIEYAPYEFQQVYLNTRKDPFVVHWAGHIKPWQKPDDDMADRFWFYARQTPLYEVILHRLMWEVRNFTVSPVSYQSKIRQLADRVIPRGTRRRELCKKILPKGSWRWNVLKKIYYFFGGK